MSLRRAALFVGALSLAVPAGCGSSAPLTKSAEQPGSDGARASAIDELYARAEGLKRRGRWDDAVHVLEAAALLANENGADRAKLAKVQARLGAVLLQKDRRRGLDLADAKATLAAARTLAASLGAKATQAAAIDQLGLIAFYQKILHGQGEWADARALFDEALALRQGAGDPEAEAESLFHVGLVLQVSGQHAEAIKQLVKALDKADEAKSAAVAAECHRHIGGHYETRKEFDKALYHHERALALSEQAGTAYVGPSLNSVGELLLTRKRDATKALQYFERALSLSRELKDVAYQSISHENMGRALLDKGNVAGAIEHFRAKQAFDEQLKEGDGVVAALILVARAHQSAGDRAHAAEALVSAREKAKEWRVTEKAAEIDAFAAEIGLSQ